MISRLEQGSLVTVFGGSGFVGRHAVAALARRRLARARRGAPARSCRASAADGRGRPDPCRAGQRALSRQRAPRGRGRGRGGEPGRHSRQVGTADLPGRAHGRRPRHCRGGPRGRRQDPGARVGHRRRQAIEGQLCAHESGGRGGRAGAIPGCGDPASLAGVRAGGPAVQSLRRHGGLLAVPAADRRRPHQAPAGLRGDVAAAIATACAGRAKPHTIYELGGPEVVTFRELLDKTMAWSGRRRLYLRLPFWAAKLGALLTLPLPNSLRPLTVDQVRMLQADNVVSKIAEAEGRTLAGLGIEHAADHGGGGARLSRALSAARPVRALSGMRPRGSIRAIVAAGRA